VFKAVVAMRLQHKMVQARTMFRSKAVRISAEDQWLDSVSPIGVDPFKLTVLYTSWAGFDECDLNLHLSNSSYAKILDCARLRAALAMFPLFLRAGGWIPLAATHFHFIREIPMFSRFEVRVSIGAWDHKWLYVLAKFVTKPSGKNKKRKKITQSPPSVNNGTGALFNATVDATISPSSNGDTPSTSRANGGIDDVLQAAVASLASEPEPDGAIVNTISISRCVFKVGRVTVPPALVFACNGVSTPPPASVPPYSHSNPPPHWQRVKSIASQPLGGSPKALQTFLKEGWRDVPESERWWESALGGAVEEKRKKAAEVMQHLTAGMDGARSI